MRIWYKKWKDNRMVGDYLYEDNSDDTRTHKIFNSLAKCAMEFDLSTPIWLEKTIRDFKRGAKAKFTQDNFPDEIDFDYLEISVIEED